MPQAPRSRRLKRQRSLTLRNQSFSTHFWHQPLRFVTLVDLSRLYLPASYSLILTTMSETSQPLITPYKMMMKRQFILLQHLLGLRSSPSEAPTFCSLPNSSIKDIVFVCIDTEFISDGRKLCHQAFQFGISMLDTRDLQSLISAPRSAPPRLPDLLKTHNFCAASPEYCLKVSNKYLFGESETIRLEEIQPRIQAIIPDRDIVLVMHDGNNDLRFAKELGISIQAICTIDTQMVAQHPLQLTHKASLRELLIILNCPFQHIHVAGNDANFTLRALLMLAVRNPDVLNLSEEQLAAISTFQAVAQFPRLRSKVENPRGKKT